MSLSFDHFRGSLSRFALISLGVLVSNALWAAPPVFLYENDYAGQFGSRGSLDGQFIQPFGIAQDSSGNTFVVDISNSRVQKFDGAGQFVSKFGSTGMGDGQFMSPSGVAINSSDDIYVVDFNTNQVQQFDADGVFVRKWGSGGSASGEFQNPRFLTIGPDGNVYVSDYGNDRIQVFEPDGDFVRAFGTSGTGDGQLDFPDGIAVAANGATYVVDRGNHRVQVFDSSGSFVRKWGAFGSGDGQFDSPSGLALGSDGIVYVADYNNDRVQAFNTDGVFLGKWGTTGSGNGEFLGPNGVSVTSSGRVYVSNSESSNGHRVQYFDPIWNVKMDEDGAPTAFALTLNAFDGDADTITWSIDSSPSSGDAAVSGTGASKAISYVPNADFVGADNFDVKIADGNGGFASKTVWVTVNTQPDAPVIAQGAGPLEVTMSAVEPFSNPGVTATDADGDTITWSLAVPASHGTATVSGTGIAPSMFDYTPEEGYSGVDTFTVEASDGTLSDTIVVEVTIEAPPVITQGAGPLEVTMAEDGSFAAPALGATDADTSAGSLTWSVTSQATSGFADAGGTGPSPDPFIYTPATDFAGSDSFTVQVSDGMLSDTIVVHVTVTPEPDPPVIFQGDGPLFVTMSEDSSPIDFVRPTLYATDVDGDTLTWSVAAHGADGTAIVSGTGSSATVLDFVPNLNYNGEDSLWVQVSDGALTDVIQIRVTLEPVNDAPEIVQGAGPIATSYNQGGDNAGFQAPGVGANDVDDLEEDLVWSLASQASHGTATVSGMGAVPEVFTYVADPEYLGEDSFEIQVSDGLLTDTITINVTMNEVNDPPVITQGGAPVVVVMDEDGSPQAFAAPALDATDLDGDSLTWSLAAQASHGEAVVSGSGASPEVMTYVPVANFNGTDTFTLEVSDGRDGAAQIDVTVTVNPRPDPPVIAQGDSASGTFTYQGLSGQFAAPIVTAFDPDDDELTWSVATQASHGTATASGTGTSPAVFTYTPETAYLGSDSFGITVSDGEGGEASITIDVEVARINDVPVITQGAGPIVMIMNEGQAFVPPALSATEGDGDTLTWSLSVAPAHGEATVEGEGPSPTTLSYIPEAGYFGTDSFTVEVSDGNGGSDHIEFAMTINEVFDPPAIDQGAGPVAVTMDEDGVPTAFAAPALSATDLDSDASELTWSLASPPTHGAATVSGTGATPELFDYVPAENYHGSDSFIARVADAEGGADTITITVTVNAVNDPLELVDMGSTERSGSWLVSLPAGASALTRLPLAIGPNGKVYTGGESGIQVFSPEGVFERIFAAFAADSLAVLDDGSVVATKTNPAVIKKFTSSGELVANWPAATDLFQPPPNPNDFFPFVKTERLHTVSRAPSGGVYISRTSRDYFGFSEELFWQQLDATGALVFTSPVLDTSPYNYYLTSSSNRIALASDTGNQIYVWDREIRVLDVARTVLRSFAEPYAGPGIEHIMAARPDGAQLFLAAANQPAVEVRDANGQPTGSILNGAVSGIAAVNSGRVYISDHTRHRVDIYEQHPSGDVIYGVAMEDQTYTIGIRALDVDGAPLTWSVVESATAGTASVTAASGFGEAQVTYVPQANTFGKDSFKVQVSDGEYTDTTQFEIDVKSINDLPVIAEGAGPINVAMDEDGTPVAFVAPQVTASDIEDETLTWSVASGPAHGTAVVTGEGDSPEVFTYTPAANYNGIDEFAVRATDADGGFATTTIRVTLASLNDAPDLGEYFEYKVEGSWPIGLPEGATALETLAIAQAPNGDIYASTGKSIEVYGPEGEAIRSIPFVGALGLGVDSAEKIYVAVGGAPYVRKLLADGTVDTSWVVSGDLFPASIQDPFPGGLAKANVSHRVERIAVSPAGEARFIQQVFYSAGNFTRLIKMHALNSAGALAFSKEYSPEYENPGSLIVTGSPFNNRYAVATSASGESFVRKQETITTFDSRYFYLRRAEKVNSYGPTGNASGGFETNGLSNGARNREVAVRPDGAYLAASDSGRVGVDIHNRAGRVVSQFGGSGTGPGLLRTVSGLAMDSTGRVYVADRLNRRIQYFDIVPDSNIITVFVNEGWDFDLPVNAVDADGDTVVWTVITAPGHGALRVGATLRYTAEENFEGEDTFEVRASDGHGGETTRTIHVIINPIEDPPVIDQGAGPIAVVTDKNKPFNQSAITATDPDSADVLAWTVIGGPSNGVIQRTGADTSRFAFTYTPARNYVGRDSVRLRVSDGNGGEDTIEIAITVRDVVDNTTGGTPQQNAGRILANFSLLDVNQDGKVSLAETQSAYPEIEGADFDELDLDGDGFLTEAELDGVDGPSTGCKDPGAAKDYFSLDGGGILSDLKDLFLRIAGY